MQALGLNRAECMFRAGMYLEGATFPTRLGHEAAGIVAAHRYMEGNTQFRKIVVSV